MSKSQKELTSNFCYFGVRFREEFRPNTWQESTIMFNVQDRVGHEGLFSIKSITIQEVLKSLCKKA